MTDTTATPERVAARIEEQTKLLDSPTLSEEQRGELLLGLIRSRVIVAHERDDGTYVFGTLRFVGFEVPAAEFLNLRKELNTTLAERAVLRFTDPLGSDHPAYAAMLAWLHGYGVRPNSKARLFLLRLGQPVPELPTEASMASRLAEHVIGLFALLPPEAQAEVRRRIDALRA